MTEIISDLSELLGLTVEQPLRASSTVPLLTQLAHYGIRPNLPVRILRVSVMGHLPLLASTAGAVELGDRLPATITSELKFNDAIAAQCPGAMVGTLCIETTQKNARSPEKRLWVLLSVRGNNAPNVMGVTLMTLVNDAAGRQHSGDCSLAVREARKYQCWIAAIPAARLFC